MKNVDAGTRKRQIVAFFNGFRFKNIMVKPTKFNTTSNVFVTFWTNADMQKAKYEKDKNNVKFKGRKVEYAFDWSSARYTFICLLIKY